jgi:uncharacterized protein (DUF427 family)
MFTSDASPTISITPTSRRVRAQHAGHIIADSDDALVVREEGQPAWHFFPIDDVEMGYLGRTGQVVHCASRGDAETYTLTHEGEILEDVAKVYVDPTPLAEALRDRVGFDPRRIEIYEIDEADLANADLEHPPTRQTAI